MPGPDGDRQASGSERGSTVFLTTHYLDEAEALADHLAIMHHGEIAHTGTLREIVDAHPSRIVFDHPGFALPPLDGAQVDAATRVTVTTSTLQEHLYEVIGWARAHGVELTGLEARSASLESVFLALAEHPAPTPTSTPAPIGATR